MDYIKLYEDIMDLDADIDPQSKVVKPTSKVTIDIIGTGELTLNNITPQSNLEQLTQEITNAIRADKSGNFSNWRGAISLDAKLQGMKSKALMDLFPKFPEGLEFSLEMGGADNNSHILSINTKVPQIPVVKESGLYSVHKKLG